jgi:hypothetical protein
MRIVGSSAMYEDGRRAAETGFVEMKSDAVRQGNVHAGPSSRFPGVALARQLFVRSPPVRRSAIAEPRTGA